MLKKTPNIKVTTFDHSVMFKNSETSCLYCGVSVKKGEDRWDGIEKDVRNIITNANKKIPKGPEFKSESYGLETREALIQDRIGPRRMETYAKKKTDKSGKVANFEDDVFYTLTGTVCSRCADEFMSAVRANFMTLKIEKKIIKDERKVLGKESKMEITDSNAIHISIEHDNLIKSWLNRAINLQYVQKK